MQVHQPSALALSQLAQLSPTSPSLRSKYSYDLDPFLQHGIYSLLINLKTSRDAVRSVSGPCCGRSARWVHHDRSVPPDCPRLLHDIAYPGDSFLLLLPVVMHPLDLVKVRFQIADKGKGPARMPSAGFGREVYGAMKDAVTKDGWRGLYRGLSPNVAGNASSWGLYFLL